MVRFVLLFLFCFICQFISTIADSKIESKKKMTTSSPTLNFNPECVALLNEQISLEIQAYYAYEQLATIFGTEDVALNGFKKYFRKEANEEIEHARKFIDYITKRGGKFKFDTIKKLEEKNWSNTIEIIQFTLQLEEAVLQKIENIQRIAEKYDDIHLQIFIASFYKQQVDDIYKLKQLIKKLERAGTGVGLNILDKEMDD